MLPRREEFIRDVREAVRLEHRPAAVTDSEVVSGSTLTKARARVAVWLTPKIIAKYDPADFSSSRDDARDRLLRAVGLFRDAVSPIGRPESHPQNGEWARGLDAFHELAHATAEIVLSEWLQAGESLISEVEQWSAEFGWPARREPKQFSETLLGDYNLPQLHVYARQNLYVLDPIARFVPGAAGAFDLSIQPSYFVASLYRDFDEKWLLYLDVGNGAIGTPKTDWNKESFKTAVEELKALL